MTERLYAIGARLTRANAGARTPEPAQQSARATRSGYHGRVRAPRLLGFGIAGLLAAFGCGLLEDGPRGVATRFWEALEAGDLDGARRLASPTSADALDEWFTRQPLAEPVLGETLRNDRAAVVETALVVGRGEAPLHARFPTHLVRQDGAWRVDVDRTRRELAEALLAAGARRVQEAVAEGLNELGEALEQGTQELGDSLREALEELGGEPEGSR
jgi:hypothetical protein